MTDLTQADPSALPWERPPLDDILRQPLPQWDFGERQLIRMLGFWASRQVLEVEGLDHVRAGRDPFVLALNHSTRAEALLVPALLVLARQGRLIHFLADWNFRLLPLIGLIYRRAETVSVMRKPAKPRFLNVLKPLFAHPLSAFERARLHLEAGRSIGIFPEGTVNRDPARLLRGRHGAARLSLETGVPVVPVGIRFPDLGAGVRISDRARMQVTIGAPLMPPPAPSLRAPLAEVRQWHAVVMQEIARLSGKAWPSQPVGDAACGPVTVPVLNA